MTHESVNKKRQIKEQCFLREKFAILKELWNSEKVETVLLDK